MSGTPVTPPVTAASIAATAASALSSTSTGPFGLLVKYTGTKPDKYIPLGDLSSDLAILINKLNEAKRLLGEIDKDPYVTGLDELTTALDAMKLKYEDVVKDVVKHNGPAPTGATVEVTNKYLKYKGKYLKLKNYRS